MLTGKIQTGGALTPQQIMDKYGASLRERTAADKTYRHPPMTDALPEDLSKVKYKKYLEWIVTSYLAGGIRYFEDITSKVYPALDRYISLLGKHILSKGNPGEPWTDERVITNFCGLRGCVSKRKRKDFQKPGLDELLARYPEEVAAAAAAAFKPSAESRFYQGRKIDIYKLHSEEEACYYGRGTRWCTAATKGENMYNYYTAEGDILYVIVPKDPMREGEKYQLVISATGNVGDFMDEEDEPVNIDELTELYDELDNIPGMRDYRRFGNPETALNVGDGITHKIYVHNRYEEPSSFIREELGDEIDEDILTMATLYITTDDGGITTMFLVTYMSIDGGVDIDAIVLQGSPVDALEAYAQLERYNFGHDRKERAEVMASLYTQYPQAVLAAEHRDFLRTMLVHSKRIREEIMGNPDYRVYVQGMEPIREWELPK